MTRGQLALEVDSNELVITRLERGELVTAEDLRIIRDILHRLGLLVRDDLGRPLPPANRVPTEPRPTVALLGPHGQQYPRLAVDDLHSLPLEQRLDMFGGDGTRWDVTFRRQHRPGHNPPWVYVEHTRHQTH